MIRTVGSGQHAVIARRLIAIVVTKAVGDHTVHIIVALRDVVENARAADFISQGRVASLVPTGTVLGACQVVVDVIRVALARSGLLIY